MDDLTVIKAVQEAYERKYPDWTNIKVTEVAPGPGGGAFAVVEAVIEPEEGDEEDEGGEIDEVCYVSPNLRVRIFDGNTDLIHNIGNAGPWHQRIFTASAVGGLAFIVTLGAVIAAVFLEAPNSKAMDALYGILALAAGFYFGNQARR